MKVALATLALLVMVGCVSPGNDKVLVNAERTVAVAFDVVDAFVKYEREHERELAIYPDLHNAAEIIRSRAPDIFGKAFIEITKYRNKLAEARVNKNTVVNSAALDVALDEVKNFQTLAESQMARIRKSKGGVK